MNWSREPSGATSRANPPCGNGHGRVLAHHSFSERSSNSAGIGSGADSSGPARGLLRGSGGTERGCLFDAVVRFHRIDACPSCGRKRGRAGRHCVTSTNGFSTRTHTADPDGNPLALHLTKGKASESSHFETLLDVGSAITHRALLSEIRVMFPRLPAGHLFPWHRPDDSTPQDHQREANVGSQNAIPRADSQGAGYGRA